MKLIGHETTKSQISRAVISAKLRNSQAPHMLFAGVAGCGKTSMARYVSRGSRADFLPVAPQEFKDYNSILNILDRLNDTGYDEKGNRVEKIKPTILFIDEVHRMPITGEELLGIAMEDFKIVSPKGKGYYWIPYFTVIGATTDDGSLSKPFRERFKLRFVFEPYDNDEVMQIIRLHSKRRDIDIDITPRAIRALARRGRGIPRIVIGYLERSRDLCLSIGGQNIITSSIVEEMFTESGIDQEGLTPIERKILKTLYETDKPIGLDNLSIIANEAPKTLSTSIEPFLIRKGLVIRGSKGRMITKKGIDYIEQTSKGGKKARKEIEINYIRT